MKSFNRRMNALSEALVWIIIAIQQKVVRKSEVLLTLEPKRSDKNTTKSDNEGQWLALRNKSKDDKKTNTWS